MTQVLESLQDITTGYSIFEADQVLTHQQLNSVADYFDDQTRLTRVKLLGIGIVCGLRVSVQGSNIQVSKGAGVTTDGDLLYLAADTVFDQFKVYDNSNPVYGPFYVDTSIIKIYQLLPQGTTDSRATALSSFADTGSQLNNMVAVLFMEGYVNDKDLCTGTDCDNLGKGFVNTIKLLLVDKASIGQLKKTIPTPNDAALLLNEIVADRPLLSSGLTSLAQLATSYRTACNSIHGKLSAELPNFYPNCSSFLGDMFASDPASDWIAKLNAFNTTFAGTDSGIQYYYDFLKDIVETWNHFRELLFGEATWCCPGTDAFSKHLLLGNVVPGVDPNENRTDFYPSPLTSRSSDQLSHARFLARKLNMLIQTYQTSPSAAGIRVTPSFFEDRHLDERAIPFYYQITDANPVSTAWNYELHRRGMDTWNYSYNAALYGAQGDAASPLTSQIGRFPFFRVEGHIGQDATTALNAIQSEIAGKNLPFTVRSVLLGSDKTKIVNKPPIRYSDLHRFHYLLRQDAYTQLGDVAQFSGAFKQNVDSAVDAGTVTNDPAENDGTAVKDLAAQKDAAITAKSASAQGKLNVPYLAYKADTSWKSDVGDTMQAASDFKSNLTKVVKTDYTTPFDSLIGSTHTLWIDWLDNIIQQKDDQADDKLLFSKFVTEHPGIEHFAGAPRGGTFVLVYDTSNKVVADFALAYVCCDKAEDQPDEPTLTKPGWKPGSVITGGVKINPSLNSSLNKFVDDPSLNSSLDKFVGNKLDTFKDEVVNPAINTQSGLMNKTFTLFGNLAANPAIKLTTATPDVSDPLLAANLAEMSAQKDQIDILNKQIASPETSDSDRATAQATLEAKQQDLANKTSDVANLLATAKEGQISGADQDVALNAISAGASQLTTNQAQTAAKTAIAQATAKTTNVALQNRFSQIGKTFK